MIIHSADETYVVQVMTSAVEYKIFDFDSPKTKSVTRILLSRPFKVKDPVLGTVIVPAEVLILIVVVVRAVELETQDIDVNLVALRAND